MGKVISIWAHCSDSFSMRARDDTGKRTLHYNGYVPAFLGGGDDVELEIDVDTGRILNWDADKAKAEIAEIEQEEAEPSSIYLMPIS